MKLSAILSLILLITAFLVTGGRLWWVHVDGKVSGTIAKQAVPEIGAYCAGLSDDSHIDYKFKEDMTVDFQCSIWDYSFPAWPFVEAFNLPIPEALMIRASEHYGDTFQERVSSVKELKASLIENITNTTVSEEYDIHEAVHSASSETTNHDISDIALNIPASELPVANTVVQIGKDGKPYTKEDMLKDEAEERLEYLKAEMIGKLINYGQVDDKIYQWHFWLNHFSANVEAHLALWHPVSTGDEIDHLVETEAYEYRFDLIQESQELNRHQFARHFQAS